MGYQSSTESALRTLPHIVTIKSYSIYEILYMLVDIIKAVHWRI